MKIKVPSYYKEFKCIGAACEDTCCAGWDVVIDEETYQRYQSMSGAFGERLRRHMRVDEEGDYIFVLKGNRCPFLNGENLCDIYRESGEDFLCHTCHQYPRYTVAFGTIREKGISLSCPEAARIILEQKGPAVFEVLDGDEDCDELGQDEQDILALFFQCREVIYQILEISDISLGIQSAMVLRFVQAIQDKIDFGELNQIKSICEKYSEKNQINTWMKELQGCKDSAYDEIRYADAYRYAQTYKGLEHINDEDPLGLKQMISRYWTIDDEEEEGSRAYIKGHEMFNAFYLNEMPVFKKILVYFVDRYFMKSFYDYDMSAKIKVALMSIIMIKELAVMRWCEQGQFSRADMVEISHRYSKDVEHLEENVEALERIFETEEVYSVERLVRMLVCGFDC